MATTTHRSDAQRPLDNGAGSSAISRSVILVLCGYLVGITASRVCSPGMDLCALAAAAIGLIAHCVFASQARHRQAEDARLAVQRAAVRLERRVEQHVRIPSARFWRELHAARPRMHEQYIAVVRSPWSPACAAGPPAAPSRRDFRTANLLG
jgi:hypothetical protein